jgi:hypothetical protein
LIIRTQFLTLLTNVVVMHHRFRYKHPPPWFFFTHQRVRNSKCAWLHQHSIITVNLHCHSSHSEGRHVIKPSLVDLLELIWISTPLRSHNTFSSQIPNTPSRFSQPSSRVDDLLDISTPSPQHVGVDVDDGEASKRLVQSSPDRLRLVGGWKRCGFSG